MVKKDFSAFSKSSSVIRDSTVSIHVAKFNQLICESQVLVGDCYFFSRCKQLSMPPIGQRKQLRG